MVGKRIVPGTGFAVFPLLSGNGSSSSRFEGSFDYPACLSRQMIDLIS
jgi:hypothetical protein